jgi:general stress protein 26
MSQVWLPFEDTKELMIRSLQKHSLGVLPTSKGDMVRAGMMRIISKGLKVYCFTDMNSRKYKQIESNPNVALVVQNIQIEGQAALKGKPANEASFLEAYKESLPLSSS